MEQVVQVCSSENLDLCCTLIEKVIVPQDPAKRLLLKRLLLVQAAKEKALRDVEESLAPAFAIRRKHREQTGLPYYDMSIFTSGRYPASLPEALRAWQSDLRIIGCLSAKCRLSSHPCATRSKSWGVASCPASRVRGLFAHPPRDRRPRSAAIRLRPVPDYQWCAGPKQ